MTDNVLRVRTSERTLTVDSGRCRQRFAIALSFLAILFILITAATYSWSSSSSYFKWLPFTGTNMSPVLISICNDSARSSSGTNSSGSSSGVYPLNFHDYLVANEFDIKGFAKKDGYPRLSSEVTKVLYLLADYVSIPPPEEVKVDIRPEPLPRVDDINCNDGYFRGRRSKPAPIIDVIFFGYELDLLEIRLFELEEVVDEFVIWEGGFNQRGDRKPLLFSQNWERYSRFAHKIIHIVQDDSDIPNIKGHKENLKSGNNWSNERRMRFHAIEGYIKFKGGEENIPSDHLLISGDLDEIPSATSIQAFKYCNKPGKTAAFYTTMWRIDLEHIAVMSDYNGYWSQPMISQIGLGYRWIQQNRVPWKNYRGAHMNRCLPPAALAFKELCLAEEGRVPSTWDLHHEYLIKRCQWLVTRKAIHASKWAKPKYIPWFAVANPGRFPYLFPSQCPKFDLPSNSFCDPYK